MYNSILFVAPYARMAAKARRVAAAMGIELPVVVGNDEKGVKEVGNFKDASIFISRGGTSRLLKRYFPDKRVIEIAASFTDISKGIEELIAKGCKNIAVITHDNIIGMGQSKISFGREQVQIIPCESASEIELNITKKIQEGVDGIVGCFLAVSTATRLKIPSSFIDADSASLKQAILEALSYNAAISTQENSLAQLKALIDNIEEGIVIFDESLVPIYSNDGAQKIFTGEEPKLWHQHLRRYLDRSHRNPHVITINSRQVVARTAVLPGDERHMLVILQEGSFIEQSEKAMRIASYAKGHYAKLSFDDLLFFDPVMIDTVERAKKFARSDSTVLISGETGAGKEGFAQSIHRASLRSNMPFVSVNCASLPQGLIASELFGYVEGAFTGARQAGKRGLFEQAQGGTIFLDEITEIPLEVQAQFLRVLQEREVVRVGDDKVIPLDIRVICATNRNILPLCEEGKFRYDLYYRINVLKLRIPPLRERLNDIVPLFTSFMAGFLKLPSEQILLDPEVPRLLKSYSWPGNVRQLKNIAEESSFSGPHVSLRTIEECLNPHEVGGLMRDEELLMRLEIRKDASVDELVKAYLEKLQKTHSINEMVKISGLSRTSLWRKLKG